MFWRRHLSNVDRDRLIRLLQDTGAKRLLLNALQHHATHPSDTIEIAYGKQVQELYDRGLAQKNRLPEWKSRAYSDKTLSGMRERGLRAVETRRAKGEDISQTVREGIARKKDRD